MEVGYVKSVKGPIALLSGLPSARIFDLVAGEEGAMGFVSALYPHEVEVLLLKKDNVRPGEQFQPLTSGLSVPAGEFLLGRAIGPLGDPVDGRGKIASRGKLTPLTDSVPGIAGRKFIDRQLVTGITMVDTLIPIGLGQRELILGDARSGKTGFLIDVVANQKHTGLICIYGCLAKPVGEVADLLKIFAKTKALDYTIMVASFATDPGPLIFITPQTAIAIASYFQKQGKDVLLILDDMGAHAKVYREISLLAQSSPGRQAYPGDIFYQHAHLLERAGSFSPQAGGGSITALPVMELDFTDFTSYIPTNLMSMTDGHLLFRSSLYGKGYRPSIDLFLSVSRVGRQTQTRLATDLAFKIRQLLTAAESLSTVASFSGELAVETQTLLKQKNMILEILRQPPLLFVSPQVQTVLLTLPFCSFFADKAENFFVAYRQELIDLFTKDRKLSLITKAIPSMKSVKELIEALEKEGELIMDRTQEKK